MVGSYQTITYNRYAVQSATKFKAKIVDIPFCDPESGFAILIASRIEDGKSIVLKGIIPNPVENAYITYAAAFLSAFELPVQRPERSFRCSWW